MLAALALLLAASANAIITPTTPDSTGVYNAGAACPIAWLADDTGVWNDFTIQLMTGPNNPMVVLETVVANLDGTANGTTSFSWPCPSVTPNAPIYFYQFSQPGTTNLTWTTRFTIADASGNTTPAPDAVQPDGTAIPWGNGTLLSNSGSSSGSSSATSTITSAGTSMGAASSTTDSSTPSSIAVSIASVTTSSSPGTFSTMSTSILSGSTSTGTPTVPTGSIATVSPSATTSSKSGAVEGKSGAIGAVWALGVALVGVVAGAML